MDNEYKFSCSFNFVLKEGLFIGMEVEKEQLQQLKEAAAKTILEQKLTEYAFRNKYSEKELRQKLKTYSMKKFGFELNQKDFEAKLKDLEKSNIYNPQNIISNFINLYIEKKKGQRFIQSKLFSKGFDKELIQKLLEEKDTRNYLDPLKEFLQKKKPSLEKKAKDKYDLRQRLIKAAMGRGFDYSLIKSVVDEI